MDTANWIAFGGLLLGAVGGLLTLLVYFRNEIDKVRGELAQEREWREAADDKLSSEAKTEINNNVTRYALVVREIDGLRLEAAKTYVPYASLKDTEDRLGATMEKIFARLETIVGKMEKMGADIAVALAASD